MTDEERHNLIFKQAKAMRAFLMTFVADRDKQEEIALLQRSVLILQSRLDALCDGEWQRNYPVHQQRVDE